MLTKISARTAGDIYSTFKSEECRVDEETGGDAATADARQSLIEELMGVRVTGPCDSCVCVWTPFTRRHYRTRDGSSTLSASAAL